ncbi:hypothetical protein MLD52_02640 [Puniceicoccaceae bacterium K14]|nr:hypothetical protein [Puniceicoccaceae bacterium K14]
MKINEIAKASSLALFIVTSSVLGQDADTSLLDDTNTADEPSSASSNLPNPQDLDRLFADDKAEEEPTEEAVSEEKSLLDSSMSLSESDTISVDFPNEEIRTILRNVADLYMLNLVVPEALQGTASIKLRDVNWRQIFSVVLEPVGFTFVEENNIIKVVSLESLNFEPPVTEIFMLNFAEASKISGTISSMIDSEKGGRIQIDARTNGLIVTEQSSKMDTIREVISRLDKATQQIMIETRFIEVSNNDLDEIGVNWSSLGDYTVGVGGSAGENSEGTASKVLLNQRSVESEAIDKLGRTVKESSSAVFTADQFNVAISALKTATDSKLISNPTVVTLNNQEAFISIGEQYPIPSYTYNDETGQFEVDGFEYKDIGVILRVKPSVNNNGLITLNVVPEVSARGVNVGFGGAAEAQIPIINIRKTETQIALKDGYTMGIGGLMQEEVRDAVTKVPVLGNIPLLGRLFRHNSEEADTLNLLIFITARVLPSENTDFEDVFSKESMESVGLDPEEIRNR